MAVIRQNTVYTRLFLMVESSDHISPLLGATPVVVLSKAGAAFVSPTGTVSEIGNGWYGIALSTFDTSIVGDLSYHVTATGGDDTDFSDQIVAYSPAPPAPTPRSSSGVAGFNPPRDQIIRRAGRQCGAWAAGETPGAQDIQDFSDALNAMVKEWQATGIHLWSECEGILWLQPGQIEYTLGPDSTDHVTQTATRLNLVGPASSSSNVISVSSLAGLAQGQNIGILQDDQSMFWSTISSVATVGSSYNVTMAAAPTGYSSGTNPIYAYSSVIQRPLRILAYRRFDQISRLATPIMQMSRLDYHDLPNKYEQGLVNAAFYDPQLADGKLWIWNNPLNSLFAVTFTWMRQLQDFDNPNDTADFPQEWINCLTWNLADQMYPEYGSNPLRAQLIATQAAKSFDRCTGFDKEPESIYAGCNFDESAR